MTKTIPISTGSRTEFIDVTGKVRQVVKESGVKDGTCTVYVPHTTAAVTINENADPSVRRDVLASLNKLIPFDADYSHSEGNSAAHIKASIIGSSETIIVVDGRLALGTWQGIYYCEFDGPRRRTLLVQVT
jgi:secondary thiamine-phosphate synthase enzyme